MRIHAQANLGYKPSQDKITRSLVLRNLSSKHSQAIERLGNAGLNHFV